MRDWERDYCFCDNLGEEFEKFLNLSFPEVKNKRLWPLVEDEKNVRVSADIIVSENGR